MVMTDIDPKGENDVYRRVSAMLTSLGIKNEISDYGCLYINRTSMIQNAQIKDGDTEFDSYKLTMDLIKEFVNDSSFYITYSGKTDEDYFLVIMAK